MKTVVDWYRGFGAGSFPPVPHVRGLSNVAWLKQPTSAAQLKQLELLAICSSALRPSEPTWNAFLRQLRNLQETGTLTSDESVAIVIQRLTDSHLLEMVEDADGDAETIGHVIERVRTSYKDETAHLVEKAHTVVAEAKTEANRSKEQKGQLELHVHGRADAMANVCSYGRYFVFAPVVVGGVVLLIPGAFPSSARWWVLAGIAVIIATMASLASLLWGISLSGLRQTIFLRLSKIVRNWLTPAIK